MSGLCLDAPLVALTWWLLYQHSFTAATTTIPYHPAIVICLALAVWAVYLGDRIYDAIWQGLDTHSRRKAFAHSHPGLLYSLLASSILSSISIAIFWLPKIVLIQASLVGACTLLFFLLWRWKARPSAFIPSKEIWIGLTWAAAISLPWQSSISSTATVVDKLIFLLIFAGLCIINCLLIAEREGDTDQLSDPASWFAGRTRSIPFTPVLCLLVIVAVLWGAVFQQWEAAIPLAISATLLWSIWQFRLPAIQPLSDAALWLPAAVTVGLVYYVK